jgi:hypothetical protein
MSTLILPAAGKSSRFPGMRPKWLLTMPDGQLMIEKSVSLLDMSRFEEVVLICLREHVERYLSEDSLRTICNGFGHPRVRAVILDEPTKSQSETVAVGIHQGGVTGPIFIKDCDNEFAYSFAGGNEIAVLDLNRVGLIDAKNKSYVAADGLGQVLNIVEKQVISNKFCCGGYGFRDAAEFCAHYEQVPDGTEKYISHVIYHMLMAGERFTTSDADSYTDWGTLREYRHYQRAFITLFCDLDGVLFLNGSKFGAQGWNTAPIEENLRTIAQLKREGRLYLVITSSRPRSEESYVSEQLGRFGINVDQFVMGLPHSRRLLVNDYSATNPYPSAISINLERDTEKLSAILESLCN